MPNRRNYILPINEPRWGTINNLDSITSPQPITPAQPTQVKENKKMELFSFNAVTGSITLNDSTLSKKQKRNALQLLRTGNYTDVIKYMDSVKSDKRLRVYGLQDIRFRNRDFQNNMVSERILRMYKNMFKVSQHKDPSKATIGQAIGVEIEFILPKETLQNNDYIESFDDDDTWNQGTQMFSDLCFKHKIKGINIGADGSINIDDDEELAYEARILTNINDLSNLEAFCKLLAKLGARVNKSCGLHIHLDMRDYERRPVAVVNRLVAALPLLRAMVPESRAENSYCEKDLASTGGDRYAAINDMAFGKFKTVEVRLHTGTINFTKISNWIKICHSIARTSGNCEASIEGFAAHLGWSAQLVSYIVARIQKFHPSHSLLGTGNENPQDAQLANDPTTEESEAA